jgi:methionyl-tRNA formyltransferase
MRVVVLTTGGDYGRWIVKAIAERRVPIGAIVFDAYRPTLRAALVRPRRLVGPVRRWLGARSLRRHAPLRIVGDMNQRRGVEILRSLKPDLLVLAGARILSAEALQTAAWGALNAHPAHLPGFRGTGVVGWSILRGTPVTVTVHVVSPDVDAGDVLVRRLVHVEEGDTLTDIQRRADRLCAETLADVVAALFRGEDLPREPQQAPAEVLRWLDDDRLARAEGLVASGEALRLYREASARE